MISIVVPVFNTEKYLSKCLDSIVSQNYQNIEVVLVDDGSTDKSSIICDDYAWRYQNIKVIHKNNSGLMNSWKTGVCSSRGDYIGFVDSDDWIDKDMYSKMIKIIEDFHCDIVSASFVEEHQNGKRKKVTFKQKKALYIGEEIKTELFPIIIFDKKTKKRGVSPNRVTKLVKRELLLQVLGHIPDTISTGEDLFTSFVLINHAHSVYFFDKWYPYHYRIIEQSMIHGYSINGVEKIKLLRNEMLKIEKEFQYDFEPQINIDFIHLFFIEIDKLILRSGYSKKDLIDAISKLCEDKVFLNACKYCSEAMLPLKDRLYLYLIRKKRFGIIVYIRKLKK